MPAQKRGLHWPHCRKAISLRHGLRHPWRQRLPLKVIHPAHPRGHRNRPPNKNQPRSRCGNQAPPPAPNIYTVCLSTPQRVALADLLIERPPILAGACSCCSFTFKPPLPSPVHTAPLFSTPLPRSCCISHIYAPPPSPVQLTPTAAAVSSGEIASPAAGLAELAGVAALSPEDVVRKFVLPA